MAQVILIRPGSTDYDAEGRIQGNLDIPLSDRGQTEVQELVEQLRGLPLEALYSAASGPSLETAEAIGSALSLRVSRLKELENVDHGLWQGLKVDEIRRKHPRVFRQWEETPENICPPEGETLAEAYARMDKVLRPLLARQKHRTIGIVASEPLASVIRCYLKESSLGEIWKDAQDEEKWELLEVATKPREKVAKQA
jgi:probable phosphoglycerate mutase